MVVSYLKTEGERGQMVYKIGDSYLENNAIMNKALKIGLKELINKGEILKGGYFCAQILLSRMSAYELMLHQSIMRIEVMSSTIAFYLLRHNSQ